MQINFVISTQFICFSENIDAAFLAFTRPEVLLLQWEINKLVKYVELKSRSLVIVVSLFLPA